MTFGIGTIGIKVVDCFWRQEVLKEFLHMQFPKQFILGTPTIIVWIIFHFQMAPRHIKKRAVESFPAIPTGMPVMEPADCENFSITDIIDPGVDTKLKEWHQQSMNTVGNAGLSIGTTVFVPCGMAHRRGPVTSNAEDRKLLVWMGVLSPLYTRDKPKDGHLKVRFEADGCYFFPATSVFLTLPKDTPFCLARGLTLPSDAPEGAEDEPDSEDGASCGAEAEGSDDNGDTAGQRPKKKKSSPKGMAHPKQPLKHSLNA